MEKGDKGSTLTRMGVSGWMFLLVPAYPGCPEQTAVKWLLLLSVCCLLRMDLVIYLCVQCVLWCGQEYCMTHDEKLLIGQCICSCICMLRVYVFIDVSNVYCDVCRSTASLVMRSCWLASVFALHCCARSLRTLSAMPRKRKSQLDLIHGEFIRRSLIHARVFSSL